MVDNQQMDKFKSLGLVIYDGNCGVCKRIVTAVAPLLNRLGLDIAAFQDETVAEQLGLDPSQVPKDLILTLKDGQRFIGADAYRYVFRRHWLTYPIYLISIVPGLNLVFDFCYRKFADNRHRISATCGWKAN